METVALSDAFPRAWRRVYAARFDAVRNGAELRDALIAAARAAEGSAERARMDYAFLDARLLVSRRQLVTAVVEAAVASERKRADGADTFGLKTPSIHSDILWTLNPNNNVGSGCACGALTADRRCAASIRCMRRNAVAGTRASVCGTAWGAGAGGGARRDDCARRWAALGERAAAWCRR